MDTDSDSNLNLKLKKTTDMIIRLALVGLVAYMCWWVVSPFMSVMLWALVLAVAVYPLHQRLARRFAGKQGMASTILVLGTVLLIVGPMVLLAITMVGDLHNTHASFVANGLQLRAPSPKVAEWPVVGEKLYQAWESASSNMAQFQETYAVQLKAIMEKIISAATGAVSAVFLFIASLAVSGIMMAYGESGGRAMERIALRLAGPVRGSDVFELSVATIRSVATGVIGVAFFQSLLFGIGFLICGIPFAGMLALAVLITSIMQIPATLFALPVIAYLWMGGDGSTVFNIIFSVYFLVAGLSDNFLKPLLLGRGVKAPMPVILIGALGGMVVGGFIGLFLGAVLLALGYQVFMGWVCEDDVTGDPEVAATADSTTKPA